MPFTPFHFGPGAAIKAIVPRHFSFSVFCFTQVVMDTEVLLYMAKADGPLHRHLHTYPGALGVGLLAMVVGRPICQKFLRWWTAQPNVPLKEYYNGSPDIGFVSAATGAFIGSFSHVLLDSIMHNDLQPFWPFDSQNQLFGWLGPGAIHLICLVLGIFGAIVCARLPDEKL